MVVAPPAKTPVVLVTHAVEVARPRSFVQERLCIGTSCLLPVAIEATGEGEGQVVRVGPEVGGHLLGVPVTVLLGPCWTRGGVAAIPIRWEAVAFESLFPVLDGTLLLSQVDEGRCRIGIEADYRVPLDRIGDLLDRALLHRVAESTIRSFLGRLSRSIVADDRPSGG